MTDAAGFAHASTVRERLPAAHAHKAHCRPAPVRPIRRKWIRSDRILGGALYEAAGKIRKKTEMVTTDNTVVTSITVEVRRT